jgi:hypothetical protein
LTVGWVHARDFVVARWAANTSVRDGVDLLAIPVGVSICGATRIGTDHGSEERCRDDGVFHVSFNLDPEDCGSDGVEAFPTL